MAEHTEAEVVRDLAVRTAEPTVVTAGSRYVWLSRDDIGHAKLVELDLTDDEPARKAGVVSVVDVASFAAYYAKHSDIDSEVFADLDRATITAVLDANKNEGPRWQQHRLVLVMQLTEPWKTWTEHDRQFMAQQVFAEFLEDNFRDVDPAGPVKAADLLTAAQMFEATIKVDYGSASRLTTGAVTVKRIETVEQNTSRKGYLEYPEEVDLLIKPYTDADDEPISARLRHRTPADGLKLGYFLNQPERVRREAVEAVVAKTAAAIARPIMLGRPAG
jgi:uncharacterized protein YfdQ (DUF2303 family)